jgi:hypothetical protein
LLAERSSKVKGKGGGQAICNNLRQEKLESEAMDRDVLVASRFSNAYGAHWARREIARLTDIGHRGFGALHKPCKNTTAVNDVDYLFTDLLHVSAHVRPSSGTLEVNYTKYTAFKIISLYSIN